MALFTSVATSANSYAKFLVRRTLKSFCPSRMSSASSSGEPYTEVLLDRVNSVGVITLNRPKQLNALNLPMIRATLPKLRVLFLAFVLFTLSI